MYDERTVEEILDDLRRQAPLANGTERTAVADVWVSQLVRRDARYLNSRLRDFGLRRYGRDHMDPVAPQWWIRGTEQDLHEFLVFAVGLYGGQFGFTSPIPEDWLR